MVDARRHALELEPRATRKRLRLPSFPAGCGPRAFALSLGLAVLSALVSSHASAEVELSVAAAVSLRDPLLEVRTLFEKQSPGTHIQIGLGGSVLLARQIRVGAPIDVFLSADDTILDELEAEQRIAQGERFAWLANRIVIVRARESEVRITRPSDLTRRQVRRIAIASEAAPLGRYSREWLRSRRLEAAVEEKLVITEHARATLTAAETGHVDVAIVYETDAKRAESAVVTYQIPDAEQPRIRYGVARIEHDRDDMGRAPQIDPKVQAAREFVAFLRGPEARDVLVRYGFRVLEPE